MIKKIGLQFQITLVILIPVLIMIIISSILTTLYMYKVGKNLSYRILEETSDSEVNHLKINFYEELNYLIGFKINLESIYKNGIRDRNIYKDNVNNFFSGLPDNVKGIFILFAANAMGNDYDYINLDEYRLYNGKFNYYMTRKGPQILPANDKTYSNRIKLYNRNI